MIERRVAIGISIKASTIANDLNRQGISSCKCHQHKTICIGFGSQGSLAHVRHLNVSARWQGPQVLPWVKRVNIASNSLGGLKVFYSGTTTCQSGFIFSKEKMKWRTCVWTPPRWSFLNGLANPVEFQKFQCGIEKNLSYPRLLRHVPFIFSALTIQPFGLQSFRAMTQNFPLRQFKLMKNPI